MNGFADELVKIAIDPYRAKALGIGDTTKPVGVASKAPKPAARSVPAPTLKGFKPGVGVSAVAKAPATVKNPMARSSIDAPKGFRPPGAKSWTSSGGAATRVAKAQAGGSAAQRLEARDKSGTLGAWPGAKKQPALQAKKRGGQERGGAKMERARKKLMAKGVGRRAATNAQYRTTSERGRKGVVGVGEQASPATKKKTRDELSKTMGRRAATNMFYRTTSATGRAGKQPARPRFRFGKWEGGKTAPAKRGDTVARASRGASSIADKIKGSVTGWADEQRRKQKAMRQA